MGAHLIGSILGLSSALVYGSADFFGGFASRRGNSFAVLSLVSAVGILPMLLLGLIVREPWPTIRQSMWAVAAGAAGFSGILFLYYGLARGNIAVVSPTSGVVGAAIPVLFAAFNEQLPGYLQVLGFLAAVPGIWLVSQESQPNISTVGGLTGKDVVTGATAGLFIGIFFLCLAQLQQGSIFTPLAISKAVGFMMGLSVVLFQEKADFSAMNRTYIILAGVLDPFANALFVAATRFTRLDIAAVLSSLYPAGTLLLAYILLKTQVHRKQMLGVLLCLAATVLIMS